jgi:hypothetical protein
MKYYFKPHDDEFCYPLSVIKSEMEEDGIDQMTVTLAQREIDSDCFFCQYHQEALLKEDGTCGRHCEGYQPRNGNSGICRHWGFCYERTNTTKTIKL